MSSTTTPVRDRAHTDEFTFTEEIKALAEELWQQRSGESGFDLTDWLKAEEEYRKSWEHSALRTD